MKRIIFLPLYILFLYNCISCTIEKDDTPGNNNTTTVQISRLKIEVGDKTLGDDVKTRAVTGFSVNTGDDPTNVSRTTGWELYIKLYDKQAGNTLYGEAAFNYAGGYWEPVTDLYFPNYLRQEVEAQLYPSGWTSATPIVKDQSISSVLLSQDILIQEPTTGASNNRSIIFPAHIPTIPMEHMHSMLDVVLRYVDENDIVAGSVKIVDGADTYTPYQVPGKMEYLVILPVGTHNPKITLTTTTGIRYEEEIFIDKVHADGTRQNTCYYTTLEGIELLLSSVSVTDWTYGEALEGQYTTIASNPTFLGPPNGSVTLIYSNGLEQTINFNQWGECTVKPDGQTIVQLRKSDNTVVTLNPAIVLNNMKIDLNPYL